MVEKFSDFEGEKYLSQEGTFNFEVKSCETKDSSKGNPMVVFEVAGDAGKTNLFFSLNPKARWKYNNFISACLNLTEEQKKTFELDYEVIGQQLIGKKFTGVVIIDTYEKPIKRQLDDGTFEDDVEIKESYKIDKFYSLIK